MSIIRYPKNEGWSSFGSLSQFRDEVNRLLESSFGLSQEAGLLSGWTPALDIYQDKDNIYVKAELPGMKKEDIELSLYDGVLSLSGERKLEEHSAEGTPMREERFFGKFHRTVSLPAQVDSDKIAAAYRDGILEVTLPKAEEAKPKQIEVTVS